MLRNVTVGLVEVKRLQPLGYFSKVRSPAIVLYQSFPMSNRPVISVNLGFANLLMVFPFYLNRNRQPLNPMRSFDLVAVSLVTAGVLHVVIENELIHRGDHVKVTFPRDVVGLNDGNFLHSFPFSRMAWQAFKVSSGAMGE